MLPLSFASGFEEKDFKEESTPVSALCRFYLPLEETEKERALVDSYVEGGCEGWPSPPIPLLFEMKQRQNRKKRKNMLFVNLKRKYTDRVCIYICRVKS